MDMTATQWMVEPLRRYTQFAGRARRAEYWWFILFGVIVSLIAAAIDYVLGFRSVGLGTIVSLGLLLPQLAVGVRRLHDLGRSGWWLAAGMIGGVIFGIGIGLTVASGGAGGVAAVIGLVGLAVGVYSIVLFVWFCQRGTVGDNRFGPDPLAAAGLDRL